MAEKQKKKWIKADEAKKKLESVAQAAEAKDAMLNEGRGAIKFDAPSMMAKRYGAGKAVKKENGGY